MQRRYQFADFCQYYHKFRSFPTTAAPARRVPSDRATAVRRASLSVALLANRSR